MTRDQKESLLVFHLRGLHNLPKSFIVLLYFDLCDSITLSLSDIEDAFGSRMTARMSALVRAGYLRKVGKGFATAPKGRALLRRNIIKTEDQILQLRSVIKSKAI